jgi:predicted nucleotidyltransferase component of viral defense system
MKMKTYRTPAAFKQALEQKLRGERVKTGSDLQRLRQLVIFDRFLARLFAVAGESVMLKGGLALELRLARARTTKDIDLRCMGSPVAILETLRRAGGLDLGDFLTFRVVPDATHPDIQAEGMHYEGQRYRAEAELAGSLYGDPFGIDVAFAEPLSGPPDLVPSSNYLLFAGVEPFTCRVYPLETHIAEKLHAYTVPRPRPSSRVKDLPDIALLASVRDIDGYKFRGAIEQTFHHRNTHPIPSHIPEPPAGWTATYAKIAQNDGLSWVNIGELLLAVRTFLNPVLAKECRHWDCCAWSWISGD